ncbi:hypothetical protein ACFL1R_11845 [Candidatus Latescibacterota bacterium]
MTFDSIVHSVPGWVKAEGAETGIVISSRARLARNLAGVPYVNKSFSNIICPYDITLIGQITKNLVMLSNRFWMLPI